MNTLRRKEIQKIITTLETIQTGIENLQEEEQDALDNLPEGIQESDRGDKMQTAISNLEDTAASITEAIEFLTEAAD